MANPQMTLKQLREALARFEEDHDDRPVTIWLPGSRIDLQGVTGIVRKAFGDTNEFELLIEGNIRPGSVLDQ